jgi:putative PEP-CTERM system TPR-repeat lipoprotein
MSAYSEGLVAYRGGRFDIAIERLQRASSLAPGTPRFLTFLGAAHLASGNLGQAEQQLRAALEIVPDDPAAIKLLAETQLRQRRPEAALDVLTRISSEQSDAGVEALRGVASLRTGDVNQALVYLEQAAANTPDDRSVRLELARAYLAAGRTDAALRALEQISGGDDELDAQVLILYTHLRERNEVAGRETADRLIERFREEPRALVAAAVFHALTGQTAAAEQHLRDAIGLDPTYEPAYLLLAGLLADGGRAPEAELTLDRLLAVKPDHAGALSALARLALARGDAAAAEAPLARAVQISPTLSLRIALARVRLDLGKRADARRDIDAAAALDPSSPEVAAVRGMLAIAEQRPSDAVPLLGEAATAMPARVDIALALARAQLATEDLQGSKQTLERTLAAVPNALPIRSALGGVELKLGNADAALALAKELQFSFPLHPSGYVLEGEVRLAERRYLEAAAAFEIAYGRAPAWQTLAQRILALQLAGRYAEVEPELRDWIREHPDDPRSRLALADLLQTLRRDDEALAQYEWVLTRSPDNVVALNNAAWLYQKAGRPEALSLAQRAFELTPQEPAVLDTLGWILVRAGRVEDGLVHLRAAARGAPEAFDIHYHVAYALAELGRKGEAEAILRPLLTGASRAETRAEAEALLATL